jgi:hypothetical protein
VLSVTYAGFSLDRDLMVETRGDLKPPEGVVDLWPMLVVPMQKVHSWVAIGGRGWDFSHRLLFCSQNTPKT